MAELECVRNEVLKGSITAVAAGLDWVQKVEWPCRPSDSTSASEEKVDLKLGKTSMFGENVSRITKCCNGVIVRSRGTSVCKCEESKKNEEEREVRQVSERLVNTG